MVRPDKRNAIRLYAAYVRNLDRCFDHERVHCTVCGASEAYYRDESVWTAPINVLETEGDDKWVL